MNGANTAWIMVSTALVMLMIPGLGLFYGGLVRVKNVLATVMHCFICMGVVGLVWILWGYSLAFGPSTLGGIIGDLRHLGLRGVGLEPLDGMDIPALLFMMFQGMFAAITPALLAGAFAERIKFKAYLVFVVFWSTLVYSPIAHWVWGGGWLHTVLSPSPLDFAGGNVVHMSSGIGALAAALIIGRRTGFGRVPMEPHSLMFVLLGTGMLWFGWFGFNGGSALAADEIAVNALVTTNTAAAAGAVTWMILAWLVVKKPSALGAASGAVAGLVAITPGAGFVEVIPALIIGIVASIVSFFAAELRIHFKIDESLDVWAIHGMSGTWGALAVGIFASTTLASGGLLNGNPGQFMSQLIATVVTWIYAFAMTWIIFKVVDLVVGVRVSADDESIGLDSSEHGERGYVS